MSLLGISYSPDGNRLVTVGFDYKFRLWQRDSNGKFQLQQIIQAHTGRIWDIVYSPDGKFIASASADGTIKLWTSENSERLLEKLDGKTLASGGDDQLLIMWDLEQILHLDLLKYSCDWVQDYLKSNITLEKSDRSVCNYSLFH